MAIPVMLRSGARRWARDAFRYGAKDFGRRIAGAASAKAFNWLKKRASRAISKPLTTQRDSRVVRGYGRRSGRMSRFMRKVRMSLILEQPKLAYQSVRKGQIAPVAGSCAYATPALLSTYDNADADLWELFKDNFTAAAVADVEDKSLYIKSASMTLSLANGGATSAYVDVYDIIARRDVTFATANANNISDVYSDAFSDMVDIGTTSNAWIGMQPYDVPEFLRQFAVRKKYTFIMEAGKSVQMSIGGNYNRVISGKRLQTANCALKGVTRALMIFVRGVPSNDASTAGTSAATINFSTHKTIRYAVPPSSKTADTIGQSK